MILSLALLGLACEASSPPATPVQPSAAAPEMLPIPALPDDVLLQVFFRDSGLLWRVAADGRWLVTDPGGVEEERSPMSKLERGTPRISAAGIARLQASLDEAGFATLPPRVDGGLPAGAALPNGREYRERPLAFVARLADGPHTVEVAGDPRAPGTLGALSKVYQRLDQEAVGDWARE